ncbi:MAG TPA: endolytic transglycosylase MltG [Burkholderiales bacterium]|nr:endolytic transglycosylase MltG [Burkholderiales bacterium]
MFKFLISVFVLAVLAALALGGGLYWYGHQPLPMAADKTAFRIEPGSGLRTAVRHIQAAGVGVREWPFIALVRLQDQAGAIKAGSYEIERGASAEDLLRKITRGEFAQGQLVLVEGWTFKQMRQLLDAHPDLEHTTRELSDEEIMTRLGAPGLAPEGRFFPDTYRFSKGDSDLGIFRLAFEEMKRHLAQAWDVRAPGLPFATPDEALILASIVEKETGARADRDLIAAVFINRLRKGMRLQTDPTVIYGIGARFDGNLRKVDLMTDTPYNTYMRDGLPPTPIAMPGLESLRAVMHPAATEALFFVARGDGSSHFSESLTEHNRAVDRYQRGGRSTAPPNRGK